MANPLGSTPGIIVGVGVGSAAATAIEPALEIPKQQAWKRNANRILTPATMAALVAQGGIELGDAQADARLEGFEADKLNALVYLAQTVPGFAEALTLWRRNPKDFADLWTHALVKNGIDTRYLPYLNQLKDDRLSPPVVALAIVRGIIEDPGFLPVAPPTAEGKVPSFPVSKLDALEEARAFGFDYDRLFVQTAISGRPMALEMAAHAVFRGIIEKVDYLRAGAEGDTRNEWLDAIFDASRQIPSVADYINAEIRGWIDRPQRNAGIARHGMSAADGDLLYLRTGRPATSHQVHIGWARGGRNPAAGSDERQVFDKAIQESDIRPEWTDILWAQRYTYPPFFAIRALMQGQVLNADEAYQILLYEGWEPELARKVADFYTQQTGGASETSPYVAKAETQLWTALHKAYVKVGADWASIDPILATLVSDDLDRNSVHSLWDAERLTQSLPAVQ